ncbi:MAG: phosphotransferase family protein [Actinobacteria bacterium]|nr:phosphotransferase family protein [Actinomycetota bacterium]
MDDWVAAEVIREAIANGRADDRRGSAAQWDAVQRYLDERGVDPWPARRARLADGVVPIDDLRAWLADDVIAAAPLMGAFTSHDTDIEHAVIEVDPVEQARFADWLSKQGGEPASIQSATVIGGGFSRRMWRVRVEQGGDIRNVIVRIDMFGTNTVDEVRAMKALHAAGFAVPGVERVEESSEVLGEPFFVMEQVPGMVRLDDQGLDDIIRSVADLHRVPVTVLDESGRSAQQVVDDNIEGWRAMYREHAPISPLLEHAADWLHSNLKPTGPSVIVHGDAGPGNALFDPERGLTTIDWEFAPYLALIRGRRIMGAAEWKARLAAVVGYHLDDDQWRMWLAYNHFRGGCVNLSARTVFEQGTHRTADQLAIGVAVHLRFLSQLAEITCA